MRPSGVCQSRSTSEMDSVSWRLFEASKKTEGAGDDEEEEDEGVEAIDGSGSRRLSGVPDPIGPREGGRLKVKFDWVVGHVVSK